MRGKNVKNAGRKKGSQNIIKQELKKELTKIVLDKFTKEVRNFPVMDYEKRMRLLIDTLPYVLPKTNLTQEESHIQNLIYEKIYPEFKRLNFYLNVVPQEKKASILLSLLKKLHLSPVQQNEIAQTLTNKRIRAIRKP